MKRIYLELTLILAAATAGTLSAEPLRPHGAPPPTLWKTAFSFGDEVPAVGDFNGDGLDDVVTFYRSEYGGSLNGDALVSLNSGGAFGERTLWHPFFGINEETLQVGDFNGDGRDDIATFLHGTAGVVYVALSNGTGFDTSSVWISGVAAGKQRPSIGDFNGDGRDDIASHDPDSGEVHIALSNGVRFVQAGTWITSLPAEVVITGDFNGDGMDDIGGIRSGSGVFGFAVVALSQGGRFDPHQQWSDRVLFNRSTEVFSGDFTGDEKDDLALVTGGGSLWVFPSHEGAFHYDATSVVWNPSIRAAGQVCLPGYFDRDLNVDIAAFSSETNNGDVKISLSAGHAPADSIDPTVFGYGTMGNGILGPLGSRPARKEVPLVVGLFEFGDRAPFGEALNRDTEFFDNLFFGPAKPNIRDWFLEMSDGAFTFSRADVLFIRIPVTPGGDARPGMVQLMADAGFDFRAYDAAGNRNGVVEVDELCIAAVSNFGTAGGQTIPMGITVNYSSGPDIRLATTLAGADHLGPVDLYAHEVAHLLATRDLYSSSCYNPDLTLMHCNGAPVPTSLVHLDAWHKVRLGWKRPRVFDVQDGPAQATLAPAQFRGGSPPVLLYDSQVGTDQYYLLEFRNPEYQSGARVWGSQDSVKYRRPPAPDGGGYPAAGYDAGFARTGIAPWYARMASRNDLAREDVLVGGRFGGLNAVPSGDDVLAAGRIFAGPDRTLQTTNPRAILPGPNGRLDSTAAGDDQEVRGLILQGGDGLFSSILRGDDVIGNADAKVDDAMVFVTQDPSDYGRRGSGEWVIERETVELKGQDSRFKVQLRALGAPTSQGVIGWGEPFRPFIQSWPSGEVKAGTLITVNGRFGPEVSPGFLAMVECLDTGRRVRAEVEAWNFGAVTLTLPTALAPGRHALYFAQEGDAPDQVSNRVPIQIEDTFGIWLRTHFTAAERADPSIVGPEVDLDGDGIPTLGEYLADGDPRSYEAQLLPRIKRDGIYVYYQVPMRRVLSGVQVMYEYSSDLRYWLQVPPGPIANDEVPGEPDLVYHERRILANEPTRFFRVRYILPTR